MNQEIPKVFFYDVRCAVNQASKQAIPLQALTGPEGSRMLRLPEFKTIGT
jgi:hypothetical protein